MFTKRIVVSLLVVLFFAAAIAILVPSVHSILSSPFTTPWSNAQFLFMALGVGGLIGVVVYLLGKRVEAPGQDRG